ncbi:TIM-barrel domain-containing protein [Paenibacillus cymbidii]|uniref:TIM-barrel domain-containing protein n=1 Tax=Paenibacillus cymbidii TaxID=1639034 RepID=UPI001436C90B|nr:TIM-barrel domain-containing protein [Paenibacillus cymbidii]
MALLVDACSSGFRLSGPRYVVRYDDADPMGIRIEQEGDCLFRLPLVSGLASLSEEERLTNVRHGPPVRTGDNRFEWTVYADSTLWQERRFVWTFDEKRITFAHRAEGAAAPGRCYLFSNGISGHYNAGDSQGLAHNATIYAESYFSPEINHANLFHFPIAMPQAVGIRKHAPRTDGEHPERISDGLFAPPPLFLCFMKGDKRASIGLGAKPGDYLFNGLEYTGARYAGASFYVNYCGYRSAADGFESPTAALHFGFGEYDNMADYVAWLDDSGFSTERKHPNAPWHRLPIFCGWAEQTAQGKQHGVPPKELATQDNYERWIGMLEARGLPVGTIVIDDKWQTHYGTLEINTNKWPDMKGFIRRQHEQGRRVLLWTMTYHPEGLDERLCVLDEGKAVAADATNPDYERFLRERIRYLVQDVGADGFKKDGVGGLLNKPSLVMRKPTFGLEFLRKFQSILHDETHRWKPDAMIQTQTPNPLFRESSDVLRLNDIHFGSRDVGAVMTKRARIARIAGWDLVDCDNASSTNLEEWWRYMQLQVELGIPSLYFVTQTESTYETVPEHRWHYLAALWTDYIKRQYADIGSGGLR